MWYGQGWMFGMHFLWWIFWIGLIIVLAVLLFRRQPSAPQGPSQPTPLVRSPPPSSKSGEPG